MNAPARRAFGNARAHGLRARIFGPEDADRVLRARDPLVATRSLGIEAADASDVFRALVARLADDAERMMHAFREVAALVLALVRLHEIENLKLVWRAASRAARPETWVRLWRPLRRLSALTPDRFRDVSTLRQAVDALQPTPYADAATDVFRAHGDDCGAAENSLDRWASERIVDEALPLLRSDAEACELALDCVRERDVASILGAPARGLSPAAAAAATVQLSRELERDMLQQLAESAAGSPWPRLPRPLPSASDLAGLQLALRRRRARECLRAFRRPFSLAPPIALVLLRDGEARALSALCEEPRTPSGVMRALAGSAMEA